MHVYAWRAIAILRLSWISSDTLTYICALACMYRAKQRHQMHTCIKAYIWILSFQQSARRPSRLLFWSRDIQTEGTDACTAATHEYDIDISGVGLKTDAHTLDCRAGQRYQAGASWGRCLWDPANYAHEQHVVSSTYAVYDQHIVANQSRISPFLGGIHIRNYTEASSKQHTHIPCEQVHTLAIEVNLYACICTLNIYRSLIMDMRLLNQYIYEYIHSRSFTLWIHTFTFIYMYAKKQIFKIHVCIIQKCNRKIILDFIWNNIHVHVHKFLGRPLDRALAHTSDWRAGRRYQAGASWGRCLWDPGNYMQEQHMVSAYMEMHQIISICTRSHRDFIEISSNMDILHYHMREERNRWTHMSLA